MTAAEPLYDASKNVAVQGRTLTLPFDPAQVIDNLLHERYQTGKTLPPPNLLKDIYYLIRPVLGVSVRKHLQKLYLRDWKDIAFPQWPVDRSVDAILEQLLVLRMRAQGIDRVPFIWFWPDGAETCTIMTHDVESALGWENCSRLMDLNDSFGIKSAFQIIPEGGYSVSTEALANMRARGFEINVHDLNHDGHLTSSHEEFLRRAAKINQYGSEFGALGFRAAAMYRNTDWHESLNFSYDMSIPNVAHLEAQRGGCCTVFPFFAGRILELPLTTTQDYSLFNILNDYSIQIWERQISLIQEKNGLVSFIVHPDYILDEKSRGVYIELLKRLCELQSQKKTWIALPAEVAAWWRLRSQWKLVKAGESWRVEGQGSERAKLAFAVLEDRRLSYRLASV